MQFEFNFKVLTMKSKGLRAEKRIVKSCTVYNTLAVPSITTSLKTIRSKFLKKIILNSVLPLNQHKLHSKSVLSKVQYKETHNELLPIVKHSLKSPYIKEVQVLPELLKKSLIIAGAVRVTSQLNIKFLVLNHTFKIINDRAEDMVKLKESKGDKKTITKAIAKEKSRRKIEKLLLKQSRGEGVHDKSTKKYWFLKGE